MSTGCDNRQTTPIFTPDTISTIEKCISYKLIFLRRRIKTLLHQCIHCFLYVLTSLSYFDVPGNTAR
uniref:Uncharacterized protein n=1 Tax=Arundo donax TaxID=35708 RepID=A0A0A9CS85_ARUDO